MIGTTFLGPTYPTMPHMQRFYGRVDTPYVIDHPNWRTKWLRLVPLKSPLFLYAVRVFLDHRVGQHLARNALYLRAGRVGGQALRQRNREILALAHAGNIGKPDLAQRVLDSLPLGIEHRWLQSDIDMRLHNP